MIYATIIVPHTGNYVLYMKNSDKMKKYIYEWIAGEIEMAEKYGIPVNVEGIRYSTEEGGELLQVLENAVYMKEYLGDDSGRITQINFNKVDKF